LIEHVKAAEFGAKQDTKTADGHQIALEITA
jgi:hypothetical protein